MGKRSRREQKDRLSDNSNVDTSMENADDSEIHTFADMKSALEKSLTKILVKSISTDLRTIFKKEHENFKTSIQNSIDEIQRSQKWISEEFESFKEVSQKTATTVLEHQKSITKFEAHIKDTNNRLNYLEQKEINSNIIISNVVQHSNEITQELTLSILNKLCPNDDIQTCFINAVRMKPRKPTDIPPILCKLNDSKAKYDAIKSINAKPIYCDQFGLGIHQQIFINHHLTSHNQKLLGKARFMKKNNLLYNCFYANGYVFAKKLENSTPVRISTEDDLQKLGNKQN